MLFLSGSAISADSEDISRTLFKDGTVQEYDRKNHKYLLDVPAGGSMTLRIWQTTLELRNDGVPHHA